MRDEYDYLESLLPGLEVHDHLELISEIIDQLRVRVDQNRMNFTFTGRASSEHLWTALLLLLHLLSLRK